MLAPVTHTDQAFFWAGVIIALLFFYATIVSILEKEKHAANRFLSTGMVLASMLILISFIDFQGKNILAIIIACIVIFAILLFILPIKFHDDFAYQQPKKQLDERDTMFSRNELKPGDGNYEKYYEKNSAKLPYDNAFRANPGLLKPNASNYNPFAFAAADASFYTIGTLKNKVDGIVSDKKIEATSLEIYRFIKHWALKLGALDVGITELKDYHKYSIRGRRGDYGKSVELNHKFAIALTVEMDFEQVRSGPMSPIVMESAQQYLTSGAIAIQIAQFIRQSGYSARAHIDGNYEVVCPLVARDAGLGEIGRMGLLMTPKQGPRVRIAVITTDIPLLLDEPTHHRSMIEFCTYCKKCADNCPSNSISFNNREEIDGTLRWQINQESCFTFWTKTGTDCGRCMSVCPYSHPDNLLHNIVRFGIRNSSLFSRVAVKLDDYFYGRKPKVKTIPEWLTIKSN
jgi:reductive dehalogenase